MFDTESDTGALPGALTAEAVRRWADSLAGSVVGVGDRERLALIGELERLKCAAEGAQAALSVGLEAHQVAHARRESPHRGARHVGLARVLDREMPCTYAALRAGAITEWAATILARETACLSVEHRARVDQALAADRARVEAMGLGELEAQAKKLAYGLDPAAFVKRRRRAEADRAVTLRPAPDSMCLLTALLPVAQGVACYASLTRVADTARAAGAPLGRGQVMADTLVTRITGQSHAAQVPVAVNVVIADDALLGTSETPGHLDGYGPVPAELIRELLTRDLGDGVRVALRRLYARPADGALVAMESVARCFPAGLGLMIRLRDQTCRTPWCDAPIRHLDHIRSRSRAGPTSLSNGQGLCQACNLAKHDDETTIIGGTTPPGLPPPAPPGNRLETYLADLVLAT